ncbi:MAG: Maf family nucleotide pyrophosphatase [Bacteroidia bacterium]
MKVLLGSNSPRRSELLTQMGFAFSKVNIECEESYKSIVPLDEVAEYLARKKSKAYYGLKEDELLVTADTTVLFDREILNKPESKEEAFMMLKKLSGRSHKVITGVCIRTQNKTESFSSETEVVFEKISDVDVEHYIEKYNPLDKAGAYGIQEWFGMTQVKSINGCFYNVVGLPCHELYKRLKENYGI